MKNEKSTETTQNTTGAMSNNKEHDNPNLSVSISLVIIKVIKIKNSFD